MNADSARLRVLTEDQSRDLLRTRKIGRVVVSMDALPAAFPVNYLLIGADIYFRTAVGTKLSAAVNRTVVAFQVDDFDAAGSCGWSVLVVGAARLVNDPRERALLDAAGLYSWAVAADSHYVAIGVERITGRRLLGLADLAVAAQPAVRSGG